MITQKLISRLKHFTFVFLILHGTAAFSFDSCLEIFTPRISLEPSLAMINDAFSDLFHECYKRDACERNVISLFDGLIGKHPSLKESDFRILLIFPQGGIHRNSVFTGATPRYRHILPRGWISVGWKYHVVLEFKEHILDYDYTSTPQLIPTGEYVKKMFFTDERPEYEVSPWNLEVLYSSVSDWREEYRGFLKEYDLTAFDTVPLSSLASPQ